jgi:uncharacterized membrane protein YdbT with pleckstrin-like domain
MDREPEESEPRGHRSTLAFLALAGMLEIALLILAVVFFGIVYTAGLHAAVLVVVLVIALFLIIKWTTRNK